MKLTVLLLLTSCMVASARTDAQMVSIDAKNVSLQKVFSEIRKQTGYEFIASMQLIKAAPKVTVKLKNATVEQVLNECLKNLPLTYEIDEKTIIVKPKPATVNTQPADNSVQDNHAPPPVDISGKVTDEDGKPLSGASVTLNGKGKGTTTDADGVFVLNGLSSDDEIIISYTGYISQTLKIGSRSSVLIKLKINDSPLDQLQVIAYGTTRKRISTSDVTTVKSKDIENKPVANPLLALQGEVPGLEISQATGLANAGVVVRIRGINSVNQGSLPFYVIDGVPYTNLLLPSVTAANLGYSGEPSLSFQNQTVSNPLSFINPSDIESISVLKDADATAIYGSKAANGAILITTKKGKAGDTRVTFNLQNGWGSIAKKMKMLNTEQYLALRKEAFANSGATPGASDYDLNGTWDQTRYTDWQEELLGNTAKFTNAQLSITGGSANTQYLVSGNYNRQTTVFPTDKADRKGSLHFNINSQSSNQKFRMQLSGSYLSDLNEIPVTDLTTLAYRLSPLSPGLYNSDGSLNWAPNANGISTWSNPLANMAITNEYANKNLTSNLLLSYRIEGGLCLKSSFGYNYMQIDEKELFPSTVNAPENRSNAFRFSQFTNGHIKSWIAEPQLTYVRTISKSKLDFLLGSTLQVNENYQQNIFASGFSSDQLLGDPRLGTSVSVGTGIATTYKYAAAYTRLDYNWDDRYIITLSGRRDGSSRFGSNNMFHDFWSAAGAWVFTNEHWLKKQNFLSFGKLRASYGTTGNDQISDYQFFSTYQSAGLNTYDGVAGLNPGGLPNPNLQWEETRKFQIGGDLGFLKDRILLGVSYYKNRSSNQLLSYVLPSITGFTGITANFPATVQNTGLETTLSTENVRGKKFSWRTSFNIAAYRNKLVDFPGLETSSYRDRYILGAPVSLIMLYQYSGIDPVTGLYTFATHDGKVTNSPDISFDKIAHQTTLPSFFGGFKNSFSYGGWELEILAQFAKQTGKNYLYGFRPGRFSVAANYGNQPASILNHWPVSNNGETAQKVFSTYSSAANSAFNAVSASTFAYSDASYIRIKNVALSYGLPSAWIKQVGMQSCRFFANAQNLLTITGYKGIDPETQSAVVLPPLRVWTLGVQATF